MASSTPQSAPSLLQLPDPCLEAVMQCCAEDPRSLFSAARAHSRLHQAAVLAASSIRAAVRPQQLDSVLLYLANHGQDVSSIDLEGVFVGVTPSLRQVPHDKLQGLSSLSLHMLQLQLQPGGGFQGVLGPGTPLKQLQLHQSTLLDGEQGLAAALLLLPGLQSLSSVWVRGDKGRPLRLPSGALQGLQQLTYLELAGNELQEPDGLRHLQGLTRLRDLRLDHRTAPTAPASMLSGLQHLTCLVVKGGLFKCMFEPGALAGKTQLQHLDLAGSRVTGGSAGAAQLLSHLQQLQQLTFLRLSFSLHSVDAHASAAVYSALTAGSQLQHLDIRHCALPAGVWQHMFPAGRQLPHLRVLDAGYVSHPDGPAAAPEGSRLVSCCPGLQSLRTQALPYSPELLAPLTGLSGLTELDLWPACQSSEGSQLVCQLTGLRRLQLQVWDVSGTEGLLRLTQLKQLTHLLYDGRSTGRQQLTEGPGGEPVWRQVLRLHLNHSHPDVAQEAAAGLAQ